MASRAAWLLPALLAAALAASSGCGLFDSIDHGQTDGGAPDAGGSADAATDAGTDGGSDGGVDAGTDGGTDAGTDAGAGNIAIYVRGEITTRTFTDGYSGQTPRMQVFGIGRLDLMLGPTDPAPVTVVDHAASPVLADMLTTTLAGRANGAAIPPGVYTHGRVLLTQARFRIGATAHQGALALPGELTVVTALSDSTVDGQAWTKGRADYRFDGGVAAFSATGTLPPLPSTAGGTIVSEATRTWLVFPFTTPFVIDAADAGQQSATIVYQLYQSFRWQDQAATGYDAGVFDLDAVGPSFEPVKNFGATDYRTEPP